jgi:hypothetical protein
MSYFLTKKRQKTRTEKGDEFLYSPKANKLPDIMNFFSKQIVTNEQLQTAAAGLYTWILRESNNIYAAKTISKQEIGSLHVNLDMLTSTVDSSNIYAAGELEIIREEISAPPTIIFNLLSGSYMVKKFKGLSEKDILILRNQIVDNVQSVLMKYGIPSHFLECSVISCSPEEKIGGMNLIETANIRTSNKNLINLNKMFNRVGGKMTRKIYRSNKTRKSRSKE